MGQGGGWEGQGRDSATTPSTSSPSSPSYNCRLIGQKVKAGEVLGIVESVKNTADVYSPVSGEVVEVNSPLEDDPQVINKSPYDQGWIAVIKMNDPNEVSAMMDAATYRKFIEQAKK